MSMRQRRGAPVESSSSSEEEEEDVFAKLSKKGKKAAAASSSSQEPTKRDDDSSNPSQTNKVQVELPASTTSSMKRHHVTANESRKAKMNALLQELQVEKSKRPLDKPHMHRGPPPQKMGSYVDPEEEHLTTNIFVGNLAPSITEEEITDFFGQFGDLYSVKVMWPRTAEERARNRNTGFVCFMNREDAEEAIKCNETDPFNVGRRIMMRWGKNVKKFIKAGTGGVAVALPASNSANATTAAALRATLPSRDSNDDRIPPQSTATTEPATKQPPQLSSTPGNSNTATAAGTVPVFDKEKHPANAMIHVEIPQPPARAHFISTVASFVAKDGAILEQKLLEMEATNPDFAFLFVPAYDHNDNNTPEQKRRWMEHLFYRWRVYAFSQGDNFRVWKPDPFVMMHHQPGSNNSNSSPLLWIPPPLNPEAVWQEGLETKLREEDRNLQKKQQRRRIRTGRQLEQVGLRGANNEAAAQLTREEMEHFNLLVRTKLCASRESICEAMAFCFEKSRAAKQIATLLKEVLLEDDKSQRASTSSQWGMSVETRIARLYLLSDILFNSQQPGVRNAFLYRDAIEQMAPEVFASLGIHGSGTIGRMSKNKLSSCVSSVLGAWANWGVYNPIFLDEVQARFEGRTIEEKEDSDSSSGDEREKAKEEMMRVEEEAKAARVIAANQRQEWAPVSNENEKEEDKPTTGGGDSADRASADGEAGGKEEIDYTDLDGEPLTAEDLEYLEATIDGEFMDEDEVDGEVLDEVDIVSDDQEGTLR